MSCLRYIYFGHHKCGSSWVASILDFLFAEISVVSGDCSKPEEASKLLQDPTGSRPLYLVVRNSVLDHLDALVASDRAVHVVRDPRDVIVSAYFSHRNSHPDEGWPELTDYRTRIKGMEKTEGLLEVIKYFNDMSIQGQQIEIFSTMAQWDYARPNVLELRYEDLINCPYACFHQIGEFFQIIDERFGWQAVMEYYMRKLIHRPQCVPAWKMFSVVHQHQFKKMSGGRPQGVEHQGHHYRKGVAGDWRNHFEDIHKELFKELYPNLVSRLGYHSDENW